MKKTERRTKRTTRQHASAPEVEASSKNADSHEQLNLDEIKELINLISEKGFNEFELVRGNFSLRLSKGVILATAPVQLPAAASSPIPESPPVETAPAAVENSASVVSAPDPQEANLHMITSPIVGTFYRASAPTAEPFVKLGDLVEREQTLCIIEAMKLMNEIQSDTSGTIAKIFVENGQPVEYGQPLFGIKV